eukprot:6408595-Prymnesium_polylepis.2
MLGGGGSARVVGRVLLRKGREGAGWGVTLEKARRQMPSQKSSNESCVSRTCHKREGACHIREGACHIRECTCHIRDDRIERETA